MAKKGPARHGPQPIGSILPEIIAKYGIGGNRGADELSAAWKAAVPPELLADARVSRLSQGTLEISVRSSPHAQELVFQESEIIAKMRRLLPQAKLSRLRFRVGGGDEFQSPT